MLICLKQGPVNRRSLRRDSQARVMAFLLKRADLAFKGSRFAIRACL